MMKSVITMMAVILLACNQPKQDQSHIKTATMDTTAYEPASWVQNTNVYEVNLRQYTKEGTFNAFAKELPRLKEMGVQTLWFMPITPIAQKNKKGSLGSPYACSDYRAINPEFGSLDDFKALVKQAHEMGFKVIIDWVANHTGWDHVWTVSHPDYFEKDSSSGTFKIASGMDDIIELDYKNPAMRAAMIDAMQYWVKETGIDGYRCDLASWVEVDFWQEARAALEKTKKLFWLGEFDPLDHPDFMRVFDAAYSWSWMHKTKDFYEGKTDLPSLDSLLMRYDTVGGGNQMKLWFTTNHDENSWNGTEYEKYGDLAKALAVFSFTWDGVPLIYSGQELPNMKRLEFFEKDVIAWNGKYAMADFYKTLTGLKTNNPALSAGDKNVRTYKMGTDHEKNALVYLRQNGAHEVFVMLNFTKENIDVKLNEDLLKGNYKNVFGGGSMDLSGKTSFHLDPWSYQVFEK